MGSLRVGHDWATSLSLFTFMHWRRKWQPTPVFLPENPRDRGAWWAAIYGVAQSRTWLKWLSSSSSRLQNISFDQAEPLLQEQSVKEKPTSRQKEEQQLSFQSPGLYPLSQNLNLKFKLKNPQRVLKEHPLFFRSWNSGPRGLKKNHPSPYR